MPMAERTATTSWDGDLAHGAGSVNGASGALTDLAVTWASRTLAAHALRRLAMMAVSLRFGRWRLSNGSRTMNIEAKFGLVDWRRNDVPAKSVEILNV